VIAVLAAAAVGLLSAFLPFTPVEPYLIAAVATTSAAPVALGVAAAAGQTAGKVLIFLGARGAIRSPWLQRRLSRRTPAARPPGRLATMLAGPKAAGARLVEVLERPRQATGVLLVSAVTGIPPLLAASVYLGRTPMRPATFAATCLLGRTIRFVTVALAPRLVGY
jgi:membrane protein YqaA with SNARE-associated domain